MIINSFLIHTQLIICQILNFFFSCLFHHLAINFSHLIAGIGDHWLFWFAREILFFLPLPFSHSFKRAFGIIFMWNGMRWCRKLKLKKKNSKQIFTLRLLNSSFICSFCYFVFVHVSWSNENSVILLRMKTV